MADMLQLKAHSSYKLNFLKHLRTRTEGELFFSFLTEVMLVWLSVHLEMCTWLLDTFFVHS